MQPRRDRLASLRHSAWAVALSLVLFAPKASAATANGGSALALAAIVGLYSPLLGGSEKAALARLFDGHPDRTRPRHATIAVRASKVQCRAGNVDIALHSCTLVFGTRRVVIAGRKAHELFVTLAEAGVPAEGAAGTIYETLSELDCAVGPDAVRAKTGGGARCRFVPG